MHCQADLAQHKQADTQRPPATTGHRSDLHRRRLDLLHRQLCQGLEEEVLKVMQQQHGLALLAGSGGAPHSVNVLSLVGGHPNLDDSRSQSVQT